MPSVVEVFEELRFVWELFAAEALLLMSFARARKLLSARLVLGLVLFSVVCLGYFPWLDFVQTANLDLIFVGLWYVVLALAMMAFFRFCFEVSFADTLFVGVLSYAAQHVVYVLVHELVALWLWPEITQSVVVYAAVSCAVCVMWYGLLWGIFSRMLLMTGGLIIEDDVWSTTLMALLLTLFLSLTFGFQSLFHSYDDNRFPAVWMSLLVCLLILGLQYGSLRAILYGREKTSLEHILREATQHTAISRSLIENVNHAIHDIKHSLAASGRDALGATAGSANSVIDAVKKYELLVYSDDEVLNTLLTERALVCKDKNISFTCSIADANMERIEVADLYAILSSVVDNAIDLASYLTDPAERAITLQIQGREGLLLITCDSTFDVDRGRRVGPLLVRSTVQSLFGLGLLNARLVVEKYAGTLTVDAKDNVLTVQAIIPRS